MWRAMLAVSLAGTLACACGGTLAETARDRASRDLECPASRVGAYRAQGGVYVAKGCGRWVEYACLRSGADATCVRQSEPAELPGE